jgi:hypothetical protein
MFFIDFPPNRTGTLFCAVRAGNCLCVAVAQGGTRGRLDDSEPSGPLSAFWTIDLRVPLATVAEPNGHGRFAAANMDPVAEENVCLRCKPARCRTGERAPQKAGIKPRWPASEAMAAGIHGATCVADKEKPGLLTPGFSEDYTLKPDHAFRPEGTMPRLSESLSVIAPCKPNATINIPTR